MKIIVVFINDFLLVRGLAMFRHLALLGVFTVCIASFAQATTVSGTFGGTVDAPSDITGSLAVTGESSDTLAWSGSSPVQAGNSSSLTVNDGSFSAEITSPGIIRLGTITWNNQSDGISGSTWNSGVNLDIDFAAPTDIPAFRQSVAFSIQNTPDPNDDATTNETTGLNSDLIEMTLSTTALDFPIYLGEGFGLTSFLFELEDAGSGSLFNSETGRWENREGGTSIIGLYGNIDNVILSTVPLPAALPLFGAALAVFGFIRLRRSR